MGRHVYSPTSNAWGELIIVLSGVTPANHVREFMLSFGKIVKEQDVEM